MSSEIGYISIKVKKGLLSSDMQLVYGISSSMQFSPERLRIFKIGRLQLKRYPSKIITIGYDENL